MAPCQPYGWQGVSDASPVTVLKTFFITYRIFILENRSLQFCPDCFRIFISSDDRQFVRCFGRPIQIR